MDWPALIPVIVASVLSGGISVIAALLYWHSRTVRNDADTEHLGRDALTLRDEVVKLRDQMVTLHGDVESMKALLPRIERAIERLHRRVDGRGG
jgi:hypothetical protein